VKALCNDLLSKYPGRVFAQLPAGESGELIAIVQREFEKEGWDSKNATEAIRMVIRHENAVYQRRVRSKVSVQPGMVFAVR
jgi:hypothetical protein